MQSKQRLQSASVRNMTGIYLGTAGSPTSFSHIPAVPPVFRRRCLSRAKTSVEHQRYPKVMSLSPTMKPHLHHHDKSPPLTAEKLRNLTRKVLKDYGIPGQNNRDISGRRSRISCFLNSLKTPQDSSRQSNIPELSVAVNTGRTADPFRVTLAQQELIRTRAGHQNVCESAVHLQPERSNLTRQPKRSGTQHPPLKYLQSSQAFTRTEELDRDGKAHSQSSSRGRLILQSTSVRGRAALHPRKSIPLGRGHLAGKWGHTESGFPEYLTPRLNVTLGHNLISKTLELKQRTAGNDNTKQVPIRTESNDGRGTCGSGRTDTLKSKAAPSVKVCTPFNSKTKMSVHSKINTRSTGTGKHRVTDKCEDKSQESLEEENSKDLVAEPSNLKEVEDSGLSNFNAVEEDEETLEMDSTVHLAKQIEVIIHLRPKLDSSAEYCTEKDLEQINSDGACT
ncbi:uncharacterized protein LOC125455072 isoform X2 [Stegostoma tigrinum]|uniref:uncharacterized protein LOC125455072 isoform X2 n=1 Tax=Stegostoma tigrinum TaxID=3053191 RepID=UPI00202B6D98|nr:uncharacterized protein LOC125455072 isoform X2 [Stegostoma tigrinum]